MSTGDALVSKLGGAKIESAKICNLNEKEVIRGNIIANLHNKEKLISMEKKVLDGEELRLDGNLTTLFEETFKSLRTWNNRLKTRERCLVTKTDRLNEFIKRTREVYGLFTESGDEEIFSEKPEISDNEFTDTDDILNEIPTAHLTHGESRYGQAKAHDKQRTYIPDYCTDSHSDPEDNVIRKKQLKEGKLTNEGNKQKQMKKHTLLHGNRRDEPAMLNKNDLDGKVCTTFNKGNNAMENEIGAANGWTAAKIQRLYMKYCRAESFRKSLAYQKRYLTIMAYDGQQQVNKANGKPKASLKVVSCAVIAIIRMKTLVKRYHHRVQICSASNNVKSTKKSRTKKRVSMVYKSSDEEGNESSYVTNTKKEIQSTSVQLTNGDLNAPKAYNKKLSDSIGKQLYTNEIINKMGSYALDVNDIDILQNKGNIAYPNLHIDNVSSDDAPIAYQSIDVITEKISKIYGPHSMLTSYPRCMAKAPYMYANHCKPCRPLSPESLPSTASYAYEENMLEDAEESLSTYMRTLEALQTKLKQISN